MLFEILFNLRIFHKMVIDCCFRPSVIKSFDGLRPILNHKYDKYVVEKPFSYFMQDQGT